LNANIRQGGCKESFLGFLIHLKRSFKLFHRDRIGQFRLNLSSTIEEYSFINDSITGWYAVRLPILGLAANLVQRFIHDFYEPAGWLACLV